VPEKTRSEIKVHQDKLLNDQKILLGKLLCCESAGIYDSQGSIERETHSIIVDKYGTRGARILNKCLRDDNYIPPTEDLPKILAAVNYLDHEPLFKRGCEQLGDLLPDFSKRKNFSADLFKALKKTVSISRKERRRTKKNKNDNKHKK